MNTRRFGIRAGLAGLAAALLISGAAWHGLSASTQTTAGIHQLISSAQPAGFDTSAPSQAVTGRVPGGRDSYADVVKTVAPAVVTIHVDGKARVSPTQFDGDDFLRRFFGERGDRGDRGDGDDDSGPRRGRSFRQHGLGSGVIVSSDGYILTNNHVVDGADTIRVDVTDGRTLDAKVIGTDKPSDLALVKVNATDLQALPLGNSDAVQVGDVVLAVGNPLGIGQTVTMGIISAKGRSTGAGGDRGYEDFLQTDAPINHGNSGGALVNTKGELVGINSQIVSQSDGNIGIGFAIPSNMAKHVMADLRKDGRVRRAQLGVSVQPVTSDMAASLGLKHVGGAIVGSVTADGAADRAGIKRGDVIQSFNGQPVNDVNTLRNRVADAQPGSTANVVIVRDGGEKTIAVKLDEADVSKRSARADEPASGDNASLGIAAEPLTPELARRVGAAHGTKGVVVTDVNPDGRAADAGVRQGDVIQEVNRQPVQTVDELRSAVRKTTDRPLLLLVQREGRDLFVTVKPAA